jgi:uncharacterized protein YbjT (DUF2867 family)
MKIAVAGGTGQAGSQAVSAARELGHEVIVLARSKGVDLVAGTGAAAALEGVDAVIDASGVSDDADPIGFHADVARTLHEAEKSAGVRHHVVLSIVGAARAADYPLYGAKVAQERAAADSGIPFTIVQSTQFHEFAAQLWRFGKRGPVHFAPRGRSQPVAVREVGARLAAAAIAIPAGRTIEFAGPSEESLAGMVKAWAGASGAGGWIMPVNLPGAIGHAMRDGSLLPGTDAELGVQTFAEWISALAQAR